MKLVADGQILIDTKIDLRGAEKGVSDLKKRLEDTAKSADKIGKNMSKYLTAPFVALGGVAYAAANDIEKAYNAIAIGSGAVGDDLEQLKKDFRDVFGSVPDSADAAANALANLNTFTGATDKTLTELTKSVLDVSRMMGEDGVSNSASFGRAMKQWQMPAERGVTELDKLYKLTQDYGIGLGELSSTLTAYGAVLKNAGFEMDEAAHFFSILSSQGLSVSRIMPALNASFRNWAMEGKNSREELQRVIDTIRLTEDSQEALAIATEVFGAQGAQRLMTAIRNDAIPALDDLNLSLEDSAGLIEFTSEETKTVGERFAELKNQAQIGLEPLGAILIELAEKALPPLIEQVTRFAQWMQNLDPMVIKIAMGIGAVLAVLGPLLLTFSRIIPVISSLNGVLSLLLSPVGLVVTALAGLTAAVIYLWNTNEQFRDAVIAIWGWIQEMAITIFSFIQEFWNEWGESIIGFFQTTWDIISEIFTTVFGIIQELVMTVFTFIKEFWDEWGEEIMAFFTSVWEVIEEIFTTVLEVVWGVVQFIFEEIQEFWDKWGETIIEAFSKVFDILSTIFSTVFNTIMTVIKSIFEEIKKFWDRWGDTILSVFETVFGILKSIFEGTWNAIKTTVETVIGVISGIIDLFLSVLKGDWAGAWEAIKGVVQSVWDGITGLIRNSANTIIGIANGVIGAFEKMLNAVGKAINKLPSFDIPDWVPGIGGGTFGIPKIPEVKLPKIPKLDVGTNFVERDGLAFLHRGEAVVPKKYNPAVGGVGGNTINIEVYAQDGTDAGHKIAAVLRRMKL